jgi:hypothetical protein
MRLAMRSVSSLPQVAVIATMLALAGCATSRHSGEQTPASVSELADEANLAIRAKQAGLTPEPWYGHTIYCQTEKQLGSRLPVTQCVNKQELVQLLLAREQQRAALQQPSAFGCSSASSCSR